MQLLPGACVWSGTLRARQQQQTRGGRGHAMHQHLLLPDVTVSAMGWQRNAACVEGARKRLEASSASEAAQLAARSS